MENPKHLEGHQEWPPLVSVEREDVVEGHYPWPNEPAGAQEEVREKYKRGADCE
jgi:hypothetical protein